MTDSKATKLELSLIAPSLWENQGCVFEIVFFFFLPIHSLAKPKSIQTVGQVAQTNFRCHSETKLTKMVYKSLAPAHLLISLLKISLE